MMKSTQMSIQNAQNNPIHGKTSDNERSLSIVTSSNPTNNDGDNVSDELSSITTVNIDDMLDMVGSFGRFQKLIIFLLIIQTIPTYFPLFLTSFGTLSPSWRCVKNTTFCNANDPSYPSDNNLRCSVPRESWEYTTPRDYSIVTQFDLVCDKTHLVELTTSLLFFGFVFGAIILGSCADKFGRKTVHYISLALVMTITCVSVFTTNVYVFIVSRFVVGFFLHGTYPQAFLLASEIIGNEHRALCMTILVLVGPWISLPFLALKAYFITKWKLLFIVTTLPYYFVFFFAVFIPESVRFYNVKGETKKAMDVFKRIAFWNKRKIPPSTQIASIHSRGTSPTSVRSGPLELFRNLKVASITLVVGFSSFAISMTNYSLLLEAGKMTGHLYRDFAIINFTNLPSALITPTILNRLGRKKTLMMLTVLTCLSSIVLGFSQNNEKLKILRLIFGIFGVTCMCCASVAYRTWAVELFSTNIRGAGMGFAQFTNKIGATSAPWIVTDMSKVYVGSTYFLLCSVNFVSLCLQSLLWETQHLKTEDINDSGVDDENDKRTNGVAAIMDSQNEVKVVTSFDNDIEK